MRIDGGINPSLPTNKQSKFSGQPFIKYSFITTMTKDLTTDTFNDILYNDYIGLTLQYHIQSSIILKGKQFLSNMKFVTSNRLLIMVQAPILM